MHSRLIRLFAITSGSIMVIVSNSSRYFNGENEHESPANGTNSSFSPFTVANSQWPIHQSVNPLYNRSSNSIFHRNHAHKDCSTNLSVYSSQRLCLLFEQSDGEVVYWLSSSRHGCSLTNLQRLQTSEYSD